MTTQALSCDWRGVASNPPVPVPPPPPPWVGSAGGVGWPDGHGSEICMIRLTAPASVKKTSLLSWNAIPTRPPTAGRGGGVACVATRRRRGGPVVGAAADPAAAAAAPPTPPPPRP